ncbi:hypothetical protein [Ferrimonas kyonanensis]|uniref:hypothetical protein n=1 Tax=Ferrimonas kyonanensis TaxID=364763 RepID=UPI0003F6B316|nr:hypothetical protein [Ferrimonas kyonanensis]
MMRWMLSLLMVLAMGADATEASFRFEVQIQHINGVYRASPEFEMDTYRKQIAEQVLLSAPRFEYASQTQKDDDAKVRFVSISPRVTRFVLDRDFTGKESGSEVVTGVAYYDLEQFNARKNLIEAIMTAPVIRRHELGIDQCGIVSAMNRIMASRDAPTDPVAKFISENNWGVYLAMRHTFRQYRCAG